MMELLQAKFNEMTPTQVTSYNNDFSNSYSRGGWNGWNDGLLNIFTPYFNDADADLNGLLNLDEYTVYEQALYELRVPIFGDFF